MQPGVVVSEVARRHNLPPQQLFAWRYDAKRGRLAFPEEAMSFVLVVATAEDDGSSPTLPTPTKGQIEIHLDGAVVKAPEGV